MFDLLVKLLNSGNPIVNAKVDISYNGVSKEGYTDIYGKVIFEDIPASIKSLSVIADIAGGWQKILRLIEDWEAIIAVSPKITEDWEELVALALQITEDWEEMVALALRVTEDWEEFVALVLQFTEDWEEDYAFTEIVTTYFDSMSGFSKDDLASYGFESITPLCVAAQYGSKVAKRPTEGASGIIDTASLYDGAIVKYGKAEAYIGVDWRDYDPDTETLCNAGFSFGSTDFRPGLMVWRFNSRGIAIILYGEADMYNQELKIQSMDVKFFDGSYDNASTTSISLPETTKPLNGRFYLAAEIKPANKPYLVINFEGYLYAVEIPDSHIPSNGGKWGICAGGGHTDLDGNYLQPVVDMFKLGEYSS